MNNLKTIRDLFALSLSQASLALQITKENLTGFEDGSIQPSVLEWQKLSEFYADKFHVQAVDKHVEPIHFRLSVDYLMNIGLTINDLIAFKWYFENTRPELGEFSLTLYDVNNASIERRTSEIKDIVDQFAGYVLLNHDGTMNQFIDERNNNHVSDWRLILYKNEQLIIDVTEQLVTFETLVNYSIM